MFMSMICKLERVVEEIREAVKEVREHHGKRHRQYMLVSNDAHDANVNNVNEKKNKTKLMRMCP